MAWVKIPAENHPLFLAALPKDARVSTRTMFGSVVGMVNGHMFGGLFGRSFMVKLSEADQKEALALDGAEPFDPMGRGGMKNTVFMPESVLEEASELRDWLRRALAYAVTLPPKKPKKKTAAKVAKTSTGKPKPKSKPKKTTARPRR